MRGKRNPWILILTLTATIIVGGFLGSFFKNYLDVFGFNYPISILNNKGNAWNIVDLDTIKLSFGLVINLNLGSIIGLIVGLFIFYKK